MKTKSSFKAKLLTPIIPLILLANYATTKAQDLMDVNLQLNLNPTSEFHKEVGAQTILPTGKLVITEVESGNKIYDSSITKQVESVPATILGSRITALKDELDINNNVFPSPGSHQRIIVPADNVQIYSLDGRLEKSINIATSSMQGHSQFDFEDLIDGNHIIKYVDTDGKVHSSAFQSRHNAPSAQKSLEDIANTSPIPNFNITNGRTAKVAEDSVTLINVAYVPLTDADKKFFYEADSTFEVTQSNFKDLTLNITRKHWVTIPSYVVSDAGATVGLPLVIERYEGFNTPENTLKANMPDDGTFAFPEQNIVDKSGQYFGFDAQNAKFVLKVMPIYDNGEVKEYFDVYPEKMPLNGQPPKEVVFSLDPTKHDWLTVNGNATKAPVHYLQIINRDMYRQKLNIQLMAANKDIIGGAIVYADGKQVYGNTTNIHSIFYQHPYSETHPWKPAQNVSKHILAEFIRGTATYDSEGNPTFYDIAQGERVKVRDAPSVIPWTPVGKIEGTNTQFGEYTLIIDNLPNP